MKILQVWNTAGMGSTLAKYQKRNGHKVKVIHREDWNPVGHPSDINVKGGPKSFYFQTLLQTRKYDICHVHSTDKAVAFIKRMYPRKKVILTYHGDDIRNRWEERKKYWKKADLVTVSTPDLLPGIDGIIHTPCPVDLEPLQRCETSIPNSALFLWSAYSELALNIVKAEAAKLGLYLVVQDFTTTKFLAKNYPRFLEIFEYYFDVKECFGKINFAMSNTGFQALALGLKVFYFGRWITEFPEELDAQYQADKWLKIYQDLLE